MGHKVHPVGFRLGVIRDWQSRWYTDTSYAAFLLEDAKLRKAISTKYPEAAISLVEIERQAKDITVTLHTARPGIVIGRGGQRVDEMRAYLEKLIGKRIRLNINEIRQPELDAYLVGRTIAEQIERRVAYRRAMKQAIFRTIQAGAKGIRVACAGRLGDAEIARRQIMHQGQVPLHTLRADIDYAFSEAHTTFGRIGIKVWVYKGDVVEPKKEVEAPAEQAAAVTAEASAAKPVEAAILSAQSAEAVPALEPIAISETPALADAQAVPAPAETTAAVAESAPAPAEQPPKPKRRRRAVTEKKANLEPPAGKEDKDATA